MKEHIPIKAWLLLFLLAFIWGSSFILIKKAVFGLSPLHVASLRVFTASLFFVPFALLNIKKTPIKKLKFFLLTGSAGNLLPSFLFAFSMPHIESTVSGILNSLTPVFTLLTGLIIWKQKFSGFKITGVIVGLFGCLILVMFKGTQFNFNYYALMVVFATFLYGLNINYLKIFYQDLKPFEVAAYSLLSVGFIAGIVFFSTGGWQAIWANEQATKSAGYTVILALLSTSISLVLFMKLIQITTALFSSSSTYLIPIVAIFWGIVDGEIIGFVQLIGMGVIFLGIFISRK